MQNYQGVKAATWKRLAVPPEFFARETLTVAAELIGTCLVHELSDGKRLVGRVIETEAYKAHDPACHAWRNWQKQQRGESISGRSAVLFGPPGVFYIYLNYGMYWLLNVVTETNGVAGAVLIRALEPLVGMERMQRWRPHAKRAEDLCNGPGKLTLAMGIPSSFHGEPVKVGKLWFAHDPLGTVAPLAVSPRVGIKQAQDYPWRFIWAGHSGISPVRQNQQTRKYSHSQRALRNLCADGGA